MSEAAPKPEAPKKKGRRWSFRVRVVLAALVLLIGFTLYFNWRNQLPPTEVAELGSGRAYLDVPIAAFYTPSLSVAGFVTSANVSFVATASYATRVTFTWKDVRGTNLPVHFVVTSAMVGSSERIDAGPSNGFLFLPVGQPVPPTTSSRTTYSTTKPGSDGLFWETWRMEYKVREMSVHDWLQDDHWLEVDYTITSVFAEIGYMPAANVTHPQADDLVPIGGRLNVSYQAGFPWSYAWTIHNVAMPTGPFIHAVGGVALDAGTAGTIRANLTSAFEWGPNDDNEIHASGSGPANLSLQVYADMRFGSLVVESLS